MNKYFKKTTYTEDTLKKEYQKLAKKHHPDGGGKQEDFVAMTKERDDILSELDNHQSEQKQYTNQESAFMGKSVVRYKKPLETIEDTSTENTAEKHYEIIDIIAPKIAKKIVHPLGIAHGMYVAMLLIGALGLAGGIYNPMGQIILGIFWIWTIITGCLGGYLFVLMFSIQIMRFEIIQGDIWIMTFLWVFGYPIYRFFFYMYRSFTTGSIL